MGFVLHPCSFLSSLPAADAKVSGGAYLPPFWQKEMTFRGMLQRFATHANVLTASKLPLMPVGDILQEDVKPGGQGHAPAKPAQTSSNVRTNRSKTGAKLVVPSRRELRQQELSSRSNSALSEVASPSDGATTRSRMNSA